MHDCMIVKLKLLTILRNQSNRNWQKIWYRLLPFLAAGKAGNKAKKLVRELIGEEENGKKSESDVGTE